MFNVTFYQKLTRFSDLNKSQDTVAPEVSIASHVEARVVRNSWVLIVNLQFKGDQTCTIGQSQKWGEGMA